MSKANTYDERLEMVRMYNETGDTSAIADRYGLSVRTVQKRLNEMGVNLKRGAGGNKKNGTVTKALAPTQTEIDLEPQVARPQLPQQQLMHVTDDQILILELCRKSNLSAERLAHIFAQPSFNRNNIINTIASFNDEQLGNIIREVCAIATARTKQKVQEDLPNETH